MTTGIPPWYSQARSTVKFQLFVNEHAVGKAFDLDDPLLSVLLLRELQWQQMISKNSPSPVSLESQNEFKAKDGLCSNAFPHSDVPQLSQPMNPTGITNSQPQQPYHTIQSSLAYSEKNFTMAQNGKKDLKIIGQKRRGRPVKMSRTQPKRPPSSFTIFLEESSQKIADSLPPGSGLTAINKEAARRWRSLPNEDYQYYVNAYRVRRNCWYNEKKPRAALPKDAVAKEETYSGLRRNECLETQGEITKSSGSTSYKNVEQGDHLKDLICNRNENLEQFVDLELNCSGSKASYRNLAKVGICSEHDFKEKIPVNDEKTDAI